MTVPRTPQGWLRHSAEELPWQQVTRGGTREDRMLRDSRHKSAYAPDLDALIAMEKSLLAVAQAVSDAAYLGGGCP